MNISGVALPLFHRRTVGGDERRLFVARRVHSFQRFEFRIQRIGSRYKTLDMSERVQQSEAKTRGLPAKKKNWELIDKRSELNYRNNLDGKKSEHCWAAD